jgi:hypothetical protein
MGYVTALIGRDTVAAMAPSTVSAYLDRGAAAPTLERNLHEVITVFGELQALGISLDRVSAQLERERIDATQARAHAALIRLAGGLAAGGLRHRGESLTEQSPSPR